jgi:hypothetical protein
VVNASRPRTPRPSIILVHSSLSHETLAGLQSTRIDLFAQN